MEMCRVLLLDGTNFEAQIERKALGQDLFDKVCNQLNLLEKDYFALSIHDRVEGKTWLSLDKKIAKQVKENSWAFSFEVKFYPPDPTQLTEDITKYLIVLQIRVDILNGKLPCSFISHAILGSYTVQSELGDYDFSEHGHGIDYIREFRFSPNQNEDMLNKISELHRTHKGQTPEEAESHYMDNAKKLALYGVDMHHVKDSENLELSLGISAAGLLVYRDRLRINRFPWPKILSISYKRNYFYVKVRPGEYEDMHSMVGFKCENHNQAKKLWKTCVEHHTFFRLKESEAVKSGTIFPKFGSRFRYSGRTHHQTKQASQHIDRPKPVFERGKRLSLPDRSQSMEDASGGVRDEDGIQYAATLPRDMVERTAMMPSNQAKVAADAAQRAQSGADRFSPDMARFMDELDQFNKADSAEAKAEHTRNMHGIKNGASPEDKAQMLDLMIKHKVPPFDNLSPEMEQFLKEIEAFKNSQSPKERDEHAKNSQNLKDRASPADRPNMIELMKANKVPPYDRLSPDMEKFLDVLDAYQVAPSSEAKAECVADMNTIKSTATPIDRAEMLDLMVFNKVPPYDKLSSNMEHFLKELDGFKKASNPKSRDQHIKAMHKIKDGAGPEDQMKMLEFMRANCVPPYDKLSPNMGRFLDALDAYKLAPSENSKMQCLAAINELKNNATPEEQVEMLELMVQYKIAPFEHLSADMEHFMKELDGYKKSNNAKAKDQHKKAMHKIKEGASLEDKIKMLELMKANKVPPYDNLSPELDAFLNELIKYGNTFDPDHKLHHARVLNSMKDAASPESKATMLDHLIAFKVPPYNKLSEMDKFLDELAAYKNASSTKDKDKHVKNLNNILDSARADKDVMIELMIANSIPPFDNLSPQIQHFLKLLDAYKTVPLEEDKAKYAAAMTATMAGSKLSDRTIMQDLMICNNVAPFDKPSADMEKFMEELNAFRKTNNNKEKEKHAKAMNAIKDRATPLDKMKMLDIMIANEVAPYDKLSPDMEQFLADLSLFRSSESAEDRHNYASNMDSIMQKAKPAEQERMKELMKAFKVPPYDSLSPDMAQFLDELDAFNATSDQAKRDIHAKNMVDLMEKAGPKEKEQMINLMKASLVPPFDGKVSCDLSKFTHEKWVDRDEDFAPPVDTEAAKITKPTQDSLNNEYIQGNDLHLQHRFTINSENDEIDHDAALAEAIRLVTDMNPDMSVEKIEIKTQSEDEISGMYSHDTTV